MDRIARIGVDLAKNVMQLHGVDAAERMVVRKAISRDKFLKWFANRERCVIAMEACSSAHFWARRLREMGHDVHLIPPQFAAPCRHTCEERRPRRRGNLRGSEPPAHALCFDQDYCQARRPGSSQVRLGLVEELTALVNRLRGLLAEFGVFLPQGINRFRADFVEAVEDGSNEIPGLMRTALLRGWARFSEIEGEVKWYARRSHSMPRKITTRGASWKCLALGC
ncbi:Mobile element protein [Candidatus Burkholderia humilis]|nr:Mobile element protein [Candidatus Burkholderia humilis]